MMTTYESKDILKQAIMKSYNQYDEEFDMIPEEMKDDRIEDVSRTPAENLAYQVGWTTLLLQWEQNETEGKVVHTPAEGYKWNQLGALYSLFNEKYACQSLVALRAQLKQNVLTICDMLDRMSEAEVFEPHQRKWADGATAKAVWPVYKFIHVNTVAPFKNFRTQIRKWKRLNQV
uniref:ClbS/DfsB family four-helix bundle protein n=1 Tax=Bacillus sp. FSL W8-0920 TaxID=2954636 RepID=UPI00406D1587